VEATVMRSAGARSEALAWATGGGEDTSSSHLRARRVRAPGRGLAATIGTRLSAVGEMTAADGIRYVDRRAAHPGPRRFEHFVTGRRV